MRLGRRIAAVEQIMGPVRPAVPPIVERFLRALTTEELRLMERVAADWPDPLVPLDVAARLIRREDLIPLMME